LGAVFGPGINRAAPLGQAAARLTAMLNWGIRILSPLCRLTEGGDQDRDLDLGSRT
jgi:hypothetical protein